MIHHQKNEFTYHKRFDNKYIEQTYIAYLTRGKKYLLRLDSWKDSKKMNYNIITPITFVILCNNAIHSRKPKEQNIKEVKQLYTNEYSKYDNLFYSKKPLENHCWTLTEEESKNKYVVKLHQMMDDIIYWKDKFENDWVGFRDFIFDSIKYIDDNKLTYIVGENIAYPRVISDKMTKKYYCLLTGAKGYKTFSNYYSNIISNNVPSDQIVNQISGLLITISDLYNSLISKDIESFNETINSYLDNNDMDSCLDIYYRRIYENIKDFSKKMNDMTITDRLHFLKEIITNENKKYSGNFILYENIIIDESSLDEIDYFELD